MPPLPVIANVWRVTLNWQMGDTSQTAANVIHFSAPGASASDLLTQLDDVVVANMWDCTSTTGKVTKLSALKLDGTSPTVDKTDLNVDGRWQGNASGQPIPQVAGLVKLRTATRGRSHRGRVFLPWVAEDVTDKGFISTTVQGNIQDAWQDFITVMSAFAYPMVVASYRLHTAAAVTEVVAEAATGTQRRRQTRNR
jgi:hypothetical protein